MTETLELGSVVVIDGKAWKAAVIDGNSVTAARVDADDKTHRIFFDLREVKPLGDGMFCLPGRVEARVPRAGEIGVAVATVP